MALPGSSSTTTSVMGTAITGAFNQRDVEMKERLKLKLTKRNVQNSNEQQRDHEKKNSLNNKKPTIKTNSKTKDVVINDKNDIDDLVRFIDGNESVTSNHHEHQISTTNSNESTSKKNKKKKDKQSKMNQNNEEIKNNASQNKEQQQKKQNGSNTNQQTKSVFPS
jgi:hypothetical protein